MEFPQLTTDAAAAHSQPFAAFSLTSVTSLVERCLKGIERLQRGELQGAERDGLFVSLKKVRSAALQRHLASLNRHQDFPTDLKELNRAYFAVEYELRVLQNNLTAHLCLAEPDEPFESAELA